MRERIHRHRTLTVAAFAVTGCLLFLPATAPGQEEPASECQLVGTAGTNVAAKAIEAARAAEDPGAMAEAYREALDALQNELAGDEPAPYLLAAQAAIGLKDYTAADGYLTRFVELAPECETPHAHDARYNAWVALYNEGIQQYQSGEIDLALESFETANMIFPDTRSLNNAALLYVEKGDNASAIENYRRAIEAPGDQDQHRNALIGMADLLLLEGSVAEALEAYQGYLERHPDDVVARIRYALALTDAGQGDEASSIFEQVLARDDLTTEQWVQVGVGLFNSERYAHATQAFDRARAGNPYNKEAMENYVSASIQGGTASEVIGLADTLVNWFPYDETSYQLLAGALSKTAEDKLAMGILQNEQEMPIIFHSIQMAQVDDDQYIVRGVVEARASGAGQAMTIQFEFLDASGQPLMTEKLSFQAPAAGETESFELTVTSDTPIAGFRYAKSEGG